MPSIWCFVNDSSFNVVKEECNCKDKLTVRKVPMKYIPFDSSNEVTSPIRDLFDNLDHENCPVKLCSLKEEGC